MLMEGGFPSYFIINGKAWPPTDEIQMRVGQTVKLRFIGTNKTLSIPCTYMAARFRRRWGNAEPSSTVVIEVSD
jgi:hypothetical protein